MNDSLSAIDISVPDTTRIDVWSLELDLADRCIDALQHQLNPTEQQRAENYKHPRMRKQFIAARAQLKILLGEYLNKSAQTIEFTIGAHGKPRLKGTEPDQGLVFNLSHTSNSALLAIATNRAIGIDIETVNPNRNIAGMVKRCFSQQEQAKWNQLNPDHQCEQFFEYWCAKEAFLKATGHGIALGMDLCEVDLDNQHLTQVPTSFEPAERWGVYPLTIDTDNVPQLKACLVSSAKEQQIKHQAWIQL